jgi:PAS domain S-box-containing protein
MKITSRDQITNFTTVGHPFALAVDASRLHERFSRKSLFVETAELLLISALTLLEPTLHASATILERHSMTSKSTPALRRTHQSPDPNAPLWFIASSLVLIGVAILVPIVVSGDRAYRSNLSTVALVVVLASLVAAAYVQVRAWRHATDCQFASLYQHALDAILILNEEGVCLDANPAAFRLLGTPPAVVIGCSFAQFFRDQPEFRLAWGRFLDCSCWRGPARLVRPNGSNIFVHLAASADYLPGHHLVILCDMTERIEAQDSLRESNERLQQMADNIREIFWLLDASTRQILQVNRAYETITGRSIGTLADDPLSYVDLIHPDDRSYVLSKLEEATRHGILQEEFRILRPDGEVRWVSIHGFPVRSSNGGPIERLAGTIQDITQRKLADVQIARHLADAEAARDQADSARAEAEALRKATLALTQNLRMDVVLDTLLACVFEIIPFEQASVIMTETDGRLFVARESPAVSRRRKVVTFEASANPFVERVLVERKSLHLSDTREETDWRDSKAFPQTRTWIAVPLVVGDFVLGLLSISESRPRSFSTEHFRLAKSLAIPAAVAIHNARLYEWAQIYAAERASLLKKAEAGCLSEPPERDGFLQ